MRIFLSFFLVTAVLSSLFGKSKEQEEWANQQAQIEWYKEMLEAWPYYMQPDYKGTGFQPERFRREIPKPFVHPRILFGPEDLPAIREKLQNTESGRKILEGFKKSIAGLEKDEKMRAVYQGLIEGSDDPIFKKRLQEVGHQVCTLMLWKSFILLVMDDEKEAKKHIQAVVNLTRRLHEKFKSLDLKKMQMYEILSELPPIIKDRIPGTKDYQGYWMDVYNGMPAIMYDFLYNWMDDKQRQTMRSFIADTTGGIWTHAMGNQKTGGNWGSCHWVGPLQHMTIEGEPGYDPKVYEAWKDIFTSFHTFDFSDEGASFEPLGKGSIGSEYLPYFARRGYDVAAYPHVPKVMNNFMLHSKQPFADKFKTGGGLGAALGNGDPWTVIFTKHLYPNDPLIEYVYRAVVGDDYKFLDTRWSTHFSGVMKPILAAIYVEDYDKSKTREDLLKEGKPALTYFDPQTALMITRSDWTKDALWVHFIVNTALAQGHLANESGTFTFSADGRVWGDYAGPNTGGPLGNFMEARFFSLINIDRRGPSNMPSKMIAHTDTPIASFATCDTKYAWDWRPDSHKRGGDKMVKRSETTADSVPLYKGKGRVKAYDMPQNRLEHWRNPGHKSTGLDFMVPQYPVAYAFRTVGLVRGADPYLVIADDISKGDDPSTSSGQDKDHLYEWYMQLPFDVDIESTSDGQIILKEKEGSKKLLIRTFYKNKNQSSEPPRIEMMAGYGCNDGGDTSRRVHCYRLRIPYVGKSLNSRTILYPFKNGEKLPDFSWEPSQETLGITIGKQKDQLVFNQPKPGGPILTLSRDGKTAAVLTEGKVVK